MYQTKVTASVAVSPILPDRLGATMPLPSDDIDAAHLLSGTYVKTTTGAMGTMATWADALAAGAVPLVTADMGWIVKRMILRVGQPVDAASRYGALLGFATVGTGDDAVDVPVALTTQGFAVWSNGASDVLPVDRVCVLAGVVGDGTITKVEYTIVADDAPVVETPPS